jgi:hypothetical protein
LSIGFFTEQPWAKQAWPWEDKSLAFDFVAAMQAAIAAAIFWIAITGELGAIAAGALNLSVMMGGLTIYLGTQVVATGEPIFLIYTLACLSFAVFNLWLFQWARRLPLRDSRPLPLVVRVSYLLFIVALATVGVALIMQTPNVLPWYVEGPTSVVIGWMFLFSLSASAIWVDKSAVAWRGRSTLELFGLRSGLAWPFPPAAAGGRSNLSR